MRILLSLVFVIVLLAGCVSGGGGNRGPQTEKGNADALSIARRLAAEGNFEAALHQHIWLHDNALKDRPSYYGARLSFALADWVELGKKYPPAREALIRIRNEKSERIRNGEFDFGLLHDVTSINEHLRQPEATVALIKDLRSMSPELSGKAYALAHSGLVAANEHALDRELLGDALARLALAKTEFEAGMRDASALEFNERRAQRIFFTLHVSRIISTLKNNSEMKLARQVQAEALKTLNNKEIRGALRNDPNRPMGPMSKERAVEIAIREVKKHGWRGPFRTEVRTHGIKATEDEWGTVLIMGKRVGEDAYIRLSTSGEVLDFRFARHGPDHW